MGWFLYSVILPVFTLAVALAGCVIYWWIKHRDLNGVAKSSASFNEEVPDTTTAAASVTPNLR